MKPCLEGHRLEAWRSSLPVFQIGGWIQSAIRPENSVEEWVIETDGHLVYHSFLSCGQVLVRAEGFDWKTYSSNWLAAQQPNNVLPSLTIYYFVTPVVAQSNQNSNASSFEKDESGKWAVAESSRVELTPDCSWITTIMTALQFPASTLSVVHGDQWFVSRLHIIRLPRSITCSPTFSTSSSFSVSKASLNDHSVSPEIHI